MGVGADRVGLLPASTGRGTGTSRFRALSTARDSLTLSGANCTCRCGNAIGVSPIRVSAGTGLLVSPASDRKPSVVPFLPRSCRAVERRKGTPMLDNLAVSNTDSVNALEDHALAGGRNAPELPVV